MNLILLSGGSGKRLWPLSNEVRSKQFLKIFKTENGYESMVQRVYRQIQEADPDADVTIATSKAQVSAVHNQLGAAVQICAEPCRRDTFPAIALAVAYLADVKEISPVQPVVVCPVDPYVEAGYFNALRALSVRAGEGEANLFLMGVQPTYPSEKYGYILPSCQAEVSSVSMFREKPDLETAADYISKGALWNGGVFAFKIAYVLEQAKQQLGCCSYKELYRQYASLPALSFDYAVVEKEPSVQVVRFDGIWKDLGTWNTLTEAMDEAVIGDGRMDESCSNVHILNGLDLPVLAIGAHNMVISASPEGILVSDKAQSSRIKPLVEQIRREVRFAEKSWGSFQVLDVGEESLIIKVTLNPGHSMNYHSHERRDEVWTVISGMGWTVVDGHKRPVGVGDVVKMPAGSCHTVFAATELKLVEVQLGKEISVSDKRKWGLERKSCQEV